MSRNHTGDLTDEITPILGSDTFLSYFKKKSIAYRKHKFTSFTSWVLSRNIASSLPSAISHTRMKWENYLQAKMIAARGFNFKMFY